MARKATTSGTGLNLQRGKRLGKYRLDTYLGEGGSCEVWKARDCVEGMVVALKIPLMNVNGQRDNQSLFHEVRMVTKLRHRHIMPVKNADIIDGHLVLATELSVRTLDDCSRPMSVRRVFSIILQVLDGLAYAHKNRLVHCDVTPGNIFLFGRGRAALGDFGISLQIKGRMKTIEDYGTPGYVAPEQAYGRPTYRSDCFAVGLILYEYITGVLPRWPFRWPLRGHERLSDRAGGSIVRFMRKALAVDPDKRFANGEQMLNALQAAIPKSLRGATAQRTADKRQGDWVKMRREVFVNRYGKSLGEFHGCRRCGEPVSESMRICPWCGTVGNRFDSTTRLSHVCPDCHKGVLPEWRYCPWCYGAGFDSPSSVRTKGIGYQGTCRHCKDRLMRFMRYCPWCHRKVKEPWRVRSFPEMCGRCGWSVDSTFWNWCPWCEQCLVH
jgi:serine/threonine-protein kinase